MEIVTAIGETLVVNRSAVETSELEFVKLPRVILLLLIFSYLVLRRSCLLHHKFRYKNDLPCEVVSGNVLTCTNISYYTQAKPQIISFP